MGTPTMELIAYVTAAGTATQLDITNIPQTYKNLYVEIVKESGRTPKIYKNADQGSSDYEYRQFWGTSTSVAQGGNLDEAFIILEGSSTGPNWFTGQITDYAQSSQSVAIIGQAGHKDRVTVAAGNVRPVGFGAITSLTFYNNVDANFVGTLKVALYGLAG